VLAQVHREADSDVAAEFAVLCAACR
jgi:hypothetical protein